MSKFISSLVFLALIPGNAIAQITPDASLGEQEKSVVNTNGNRDTINGGAIRDANLFHSFQEFNVGAGREAYFNNPDGINNIFSRVTGNNFSDIQGVLGVLGNANLYLINPNGILFGENARLDVNGSFFATTADSVLFGNGFEFSAASANQPPLLTIDIPIGLRFRDNPGDIVNRSNANGVGLSVNQGETISLIGGNVSVENGGILFAPGGRIELGGLVETGIIGIAEDSSLSFPDGLVRGDVSVTNSSIVAVSSGEGGSIDVKAKNLSLISDSNFLAGIEPDSGFANAQSGDIVINLTEDLVLDGLEGEGLTTIANNNFGTGNAGNIDISARHITFKNGGNVSSNNDGQGSIGQINLTATGDISFDGIKGAQRAGVNNFVNEQETGNVEGIKITAQNLSLTNGAQIRSLVTGTGDSGDIEINIIETIRVDGFGESVLEDGTKGVLPSAISSTVSINAEGDSGNIELNTSKLYLSNGGRISADIFGIGNAGNINITAKESINLDGKSPQGLRLNGISSTVLTGAVGNGGTIQISTQDFSLFNNARIVAYTGGRGNGGQIDIVATNLSLIDGSSISAQTFGIDVNNVARGNAGDITINVTDTLNINGTSTINNLQGQIIESSAGIFASNGGDSIGDAGKIDITANKLLLSNGSQINSFTRGKGNAGTIKIDASENVFLDGENELRLLTSISTGVIEGGVGNAGEINLKTSNLNLINGAQIESATFGRGNEGNVNINASDTVSLDGGLIASSVQPGAVGNAGTVSVETKKLTLTNGAQILSATFGRGNGGNVSIKATDTVSLDGKSRDGVSSIITSSVASGAVGNAGKVSIETKKLTLTNGAQIQTATFGRGNGGNISIKATDIVSLDGENKDSFPSAIGSSVASGAVGNAGTVSIETKKLTLTNGAEIGSGTSGKGNGGSVTINATDTVLLDGESKDGFASAIGSSVQSGAVGNAGTVSVETKKLTLTNGAQIQNATLGQGDAGSLTVRANESIELRGMEQGRSGLLVNALETDGRGGDLQIFTQDLIIADGAIVTVSNFPSVEGLSEPGTGIPGSIKIEANSISLENGGIIDAATQSSTGDGGNIRLKVEEDIILRDNSLISARALKDATGGNIDIDARFIIAFPDRNNDIIARAERGDGGNIDITAEAIFGIEERSSNPTNETNDIDASSEFGLDGSISLDTPTVDPTSSLLELTEEVVDPAKLIAQNVCTQTANSEFVDIGKGGLPKNPEYVLTGDAIEVGLVAPITTSSEVTEPATERAEVKPKKTRKPPAQGWIFHENGIVELVAYNPNEVGEQRTWDRNRGCQNPLAK